jgi:hypothetical protein
MSQEQLCFFEFAKPLLETFGKAFFRDLPSSPGVYTFIGANARVLYVGQSANLRARLRYYKNARPEREPRKIIRLVNQAREIRIEKCATDVEARLREIDLIREHRPKYNRALTLSRTYSYFRVESEGNSVRLGLSMEHPEGESGRWTGAFRSHGLCCRALRAMGRVLWAEQNRIESAFHFPIWLSDGGKARDYALPHRSAGEVEKEIRELLRGESPLFLTRVEALGRGTRDGFLKSMIENDLLTLTMFLAQAERTKSLREFRGNDSLIPQQEMDSLSLRASLVGANDSNQLTASVPDAQPEA